MELTNQEQTINQQMNGEVKTGQAIIPDQRDEYISRANTEIETCHTLIARNDRKMQMMRAELTQYHNDLTFWKQAHGSEYPVRRIAELMKKMQEIDQV